MNEVIQILTVINISYNIFHKNVRANKTLYLSYKSRLI